MPIVFETPGLLDLRAITTFGINAKPNNPSPIGFFGTGLKYALAVLAREGCRVEIHIGGKPYYISTEREQFREKDFGFIKLCPIGTGLFKGKEIELPFTTELGKNWELWQAFRELYSNTLDEGGDTYKYSGMEFFRFDPKVSTSIIIEGGNFDKEYEERGKNFLEGGLRTAEEEIHAGVQVFDKESKHIYYRGMRVYDLQKPSRLTYNILRKITLTEDRTAAYSFQVEQIIREYAISTPEKAIVEKILTAPKETYEAKFDFSGMSYDPSLTFQEAVSSARNSNTVYVNASARMLVRSRSVGFRRMEEAKHWMTKMADAAEEKDWGRVASIASENDEEFTKFMRLRAPKRLPELEKVEEVYEEPAPPGVYLPGDELDEEYPF